MQQQLRVDSAGLQAVAVRWGGSAGELTETVAQGGLGLSSQASAAAVGAAHADITAFAATLASRVSARATQVIEADTRYLANEADAAAQMAAVGHSATSE